MLAVIGTAAFQGLSAPTASADPSPSAWASLRSCESSGNYQVVARNGHYGAYQFDRGTWASVGGTGSPEKATRLEQDYRALYLYRMRGWQPWTCARKLGLREDSDARSKVKPTYAEAQQVSGATGSPTPPTPPAPSGGTKTWPGVAYRSGQCAAGLKTFQQQMNTLGSPYHFTATSCYYAKTKTAVLAVQKANGLPQTGTIDKATWNAAFSGTNPFTAATPAPADAPAWPGVVYRSGQCAAGLKTFQQQMNTLGSPYHFTATSCYYAKTKTAVLAVQKANGLPQTGTIDKATWNAAFTGASPWS
ncbi:hypothetical protein GCM10011519_05140 [Marmoricola endophyticus]|uniref:Transglycosylase n=1 Tax=Marmoricola endophyticus TaxID=2040280 RepID=A0A917EZB1_9ACTN|nr:hypothetical protein GCM10011519_05140 [Marmoricola endophyticus]